MDEETSELIEKIEVAGGPDRELDAEIGVAASRYDDSRIVYAKGKRWYRSPGKGRIPFHVGGGNGGTSFGVIYQQTRYTASLDAALTLVPEGFEWSLEYQAGHHVSSDGECMVAIAKLGDPCRDWESTSATPALALCAAALKARAYLKETNNGQ